MVQQSAEYSLKLIYDLLDGRLDQDSITGGLETITTIHAEVHEGVTFVASHRTADGAPAADNADIEILLRMGPDLLSHLIFEAAAGGEAELELFEGPDVSAAGTPISVYNLNRESVTVPTMSVLHTPTIGGGGDGARLHWCALPGGTHPRSVGSVIREGTEWMLKRDKDYLIRLINRSGANSTLGIVIQWYEHV